jgi:hypothetical protein
LASQFNVSQWVVSRTLHEQLLYPYHVQRFRFCRWFLKKSADDPDFPARVLAADKVCFTRDSVVNFHIVHVWAQENPRGIINDNSTQKISINQLVVF